MSGFRIEVDKAKCQAFGKCLSIAPSVFALDGARKVSVLDAADAPDDVVLRAAKSCPYRAISIFDLVSGEPVFPARRR